MSELYFAGFNFSPAENALIASVIIGLILGLIFSLIMFIDAIFRKNWPNGNKKAVWIILFLGAFFIGMIIAIPIIAFVYLIEVFIPARKHINDPLSFKQLTPKVPINNQNPTIVNDQKPPPTSES